MQELDDKTLLKYAVEHGHIIGQLGYELSVIGAEKYLSAFERLVSPHYPLTIKTFVGAGKHQKEVQVSKRITVEIVRNIHNIIGCELLSGSWAVAIGRC